MPCHFPMNLHFPHAMMSLFPMTTGHLYTYFLCDVPVQDFAHRNKLACLSFYYRVVGIHDTFYMYITLLSDVGVANISSQSMACLLTLLKNFPQCPNICRDFFAALQHLLLPPNWFLPQLSEVPCSLHDFTCLDAWLPPPPRVSLFPEWQLNLQGSCLPATRCLVHIRALYLGVLFYHLDVSSLRTGHASYFFFGASKTVLCKYTSNPLRTSISRGFGEDPLSVSLLSKVSVISSFHFR